MSDPFDCSCAGDVISQDVLPPLVLVDCSPVIVIEGPGTIPEPSTTVSYVLLGPGPWQTNQAFRLIGGVAMAITALDADEPWCDGITLESGVEGQSVHAAVVPALYAIPLALPGVDGSILWLPKAAMAITAERPTSTLGYAWALQVGRRDNLHEIVFSPQLPLKL